MQQSLYGFACLRGIVCTAAFERVPSSARGVVIVSMVHHILVSRLCRMYPAQSILEAFEIPQDMIWVETVKPLNSYRSKSRGPKYHQRRIRHFVDQLRSGKDLEPIEVENESSANQRYSPFVSDGHHRLVAYVYAKRRRVPCLYKGRQDLLDYLLGLGYLSR